MRRSRVFTAVLVVMAGIALMTACKKAKPPTVMITAPTDSVALTGDMVSFVASVTNPDNVKVTLDWAKTGGTFDMDTGTSVKWTAPANTGSFVVSVVVAGDDGVGYDTASKTMLVKTWLHDEAYGDNNDDIVINNPGDTFSPVYFLSDGTGDDSIPDGALVDSVDAQIDIDYGNGDPDSFPPMNIYVIGPDGTSAQIWNDTQDGDPGGEYGPAVLTDLVDKPAMGTWKLRVQAEPGFEAGVINDFTLTVFYRKLVP